MAFKPGDSKPANSGRKKGTPNKSTAAVRELAQDHGEEAINRLVELMQQGKTQQIQLAACRELLDRGYGKASQAVEVGGPDGGPVEFQRQLDEEEF